MDGAHDKEVVQPVIYEKIIRFCGAQYSDERFRHVD